jgi:hypothetical protein
MRRWSSITMMRLHWAPGAENMTAMVCVPGWRDAGAAHWLSLWIKGYPNSARVFQRDWAHPDCKDWVCALSQVISDQDEPIVLVGHGLGCCTIVHWAAHADLLQQRRIKGALLVAPPDVDTAAFRTAVPALGFDPEPDWPLPFPSIVIASSDDPFCSPSRAQSRAQAWGAQLVMLENAGQIDVLSRLGHWQAGQKLLQRLMLA